MKFLNLLGVLDIDLYLVNNGKKIKYKKDFVIQLKEMDCKNSCTHCNINIMEIQFIEFPMN